MPHAALPPRLEPAEGLTGYMDVRQLVIGQADALVRAATALASDWDRFEARIARLKEGDKARWVVCALPVYPSTGTQLWRPRGAGCWRRQGRQRLPPTLHFHLALHLPLHLALPRCMELEAVVEGLRPSGRADYLCILQRWWLLTRTVAEHPRIMTMLSSESARRGAAPATPPLAGETAWAW